MLNPDFRRERSAKKTDHLQIFPLEAVLAAVAKHDAIAIEAKLSRGPGFIEISDSDASANFHVFRRSIQISHARRAGEPTLLNNWAMLSGDDIIESGEIKGVAAVAASMRRRVEGYV